MPTKTKAEPGRSEEVERFLADNGVPATFLGYVEIDQFNIDAGLHNQARLGKALNEETVARYVEAMKNGDVFPGVIAWRNPSSGQYENVDGNHRTAAARLLGRPVAVYEIEAERKVRTMLTFQANTRHGLPTSVEERLHHAMWLVDAGVSQRDAAARLGLGVPQLAAELKKADANRRAVDAGVPLRDWDKLATSTKQRLGAITTDEGFAAAAKLAASANLGAEPVAALVSDMNKSRSSATQVAVVEAHSAIHSERVQTGDFTAKRGKRQMSGKQRYMAATGFLLALPAPETIFELYTPAEVTEELERVKKIEAALADIRVALEKKGK